MGTAILSSESVEKKVLALLMVSPTYVRAMTLDRDLFTRDAHTALAEILCAYVKKYRAPPTLDSLTAFIDSISTESTMKGLVDALSLAKSLPKASPQESSFYFDKAEEYKIGRSLYDVGEQIKACFDSGKKDYKGFRREVLNQILSMSTSEEKIQRGFLNSKDRLKGRWERYRTIEGGNANSDIVPYGINALDSFFGGMAKTFTTLLYSRTGGGKTRTAINIAYNSAKSGSNVMYFTLEMAFDLIGACFDSRAAMIDSHNIIFGKLNRSDRRAYKQALKDQLKNDHDIWLVDIPSGATTINILEELDIYKSVNGVDPDLVIIDYAHLVEPIAKYRAGDRSTKFDNLFHEFHDIARTYKCALLTAAQESRDASKADAKKTKKSEDDDEDGVHKIGVSNYMAPHCETVIRLKQDKFDKVRNRLWAISDKNRYGKTRERIALQALWELTYVGDPIPDSGTRIKKES